MVSAGHVGGTRGSGIVSSAVSVVRRMRGVGGVCQMCMGWGGVGRHGVSGCEDSVWALQCCGNRGSVERVFGLRWCRCGVGLEQSCVCVSYGLDFLCIWKVQVSIYCARRIPAHFRCTQCSINPVAPYRYRLPTVYLFMVDIANPDLFVCSCRT